MTELTAHEIAEKVLDKPTSVTRPQAKALAQAFLDLEAERNRLRGALELADTITVAFWSNSYYIGDNDLTHAVKVFDEFCAQALKEEA